MKATNHARRVAVANGRTPAKLTKREHFAAIAVQGMLAAGPPQNVHDEESAKRATLAIGITAVAMADALLLALEITPEGV